MAKINTVKRAAKDQGPCIRCGTEVRKGDSYRWIKKQYSPKRVLCNNVTCSFRQSDMTGGRLGEVYAAQEAAQDTLDSWDTEAEGADVSELHGALEELQSELERLADEYRESADNIREHFSESEKADECEEKADELDGWRDEIDNAISEIEEWTPEDPDSDDEDEDPTPRNAAGHDRTEWAENALSTAQDAVNECPL